MIVEFTEKCKNKYEPDLCADMKVELFYGVDGEAKISDNPGTKDGICTELGALIKASDADEALEEDGEGSALLKRAHEFVAGAKARDMDGTMSTKGSPRRRRRRAPPPRCHRGHCANHGNTNDPNANDGCHCSCDQGWGGGNCATNVRCTDNSVCNGHGITNDMNRLDGCTCACDAGWGGGTCEADITCSDDDCNGHGTSEDMNRQDGCTCVCEFGWQGQSCDAKLSAEEKAALRAEAKEAKKAEAAAARAEAKAQKKAAAAAQRAEAKADAKAEAQEARAAARQEEAAAKKAAKKEAAAAARAEAKAAKKA